MCRISASGFPDRYDVTIGWDPPLQTFFAQIEDRADPQDDLALWIGTSFQEIMDYKSLRPALAAFGTLRDEDLAELWRETIAEVTAERGEFGPMLMFGRAKPGPG